MNPSHSRRARCALGGCVVSNALSRWISGNAYAAFIADQVASCSALPNVVDSSRCGSGAVVDPTATRVHPSPVAVVFDDLLPGALDVVTEHEQEISLLRTIKCDGQRLSLVRDQSDLVG